MFHHVIDFVFTSHFSPTFLQEISPGNFLLLHKILNFTLRQFLHETRNIVFLSLQALYVDNFLIVFIGKKTTGERSPEGEERT